MSDIVIEFMEFLLGLLKFFHTPQNECCAVVPIQNRYEVWDIDSNQFKDFILGRFLEANGDFPSNSEVKKIISGLRTEALNKGPKQEKNYRVAGDDRRIFVDIGDDRGTTVKIKPTGWTVKKNCKKVFFYRTTQMLSLPVPKRSGDAIKRFRTLLNANLKPSDCYLIVLFMAFSFIRRGPHPILALIGEKGSGKSYATEKIKRLTDPTDPETEGLPDSERDLMISTLNARVLAYDNISAIRTRFSNALCRISTGSGWSIRKIYTNSDKITFKGSRPIIVNGITNFIERNDLADRTIFIHMPYIEPEKRIPTRELERRFEQAKGAILGQIFDAVALGLKNMKSVELGWKPRMADFAYFGAAAAPAIGWTAEKFISACKNNEQLIQLMSLESSNLAICLVHFMGNRKKWVGTASDLLDILNRHASENRMAYGGEWPRTPNALSGLLREIGQVLRSRHIFVDFSRTASTRRIVIRNKAARFAKVSE